MKVDIVEECNRLNEDAFNAEKKVNEDKFK